MAEVKLGDRLYQTVILDHRTVRMDHYLQRVLDESGVAGLDPLLDEDAVTFQMRQLDTLIKSGKACEVLGAYLLPLEVTERTWTPAIACATVARLEVCDSEEDRDQVLVLALECLNGFFLQRLNSAKSFLRSSSSGDELGRPLSGTAH